MEVDDSAQSIIMNVYQRVEFVLYSKIDAQKLVLLFFFDNINIKNCISISNLTNNCS